MEQTKRFLFPFAAYDYQAAEEYLENMAEKGFLLSSFHLFRAEYKVGKPQKIAYRMEIDRKGFLKEEGAAKAYAKRTGWQYVAEKRGYQVFCMNLMHADGTWISGEDSQQLGLLEDKPLDTGDKQKQADRLVNLFVLLLAAILCMEWALVSQTEGGLLHLLVSDRNLAAFVVVAWSFVTLIGQMVLLLAYRRKKRSQVGTVLGIHRVTVVLGWIGLAMLAGLGVGHIFVSHSVALLSLLPTGVLLVVYSLVCLVWQKWGMERSRKMAFAAGILVFAAALAMIWPMAQMFDQTLAKQQQKTGGLTLSSLGYAEGEPVSYAQRSVLAEMQTYQEENEEVSLSYTIVESPFASVIDWLRKCFPADDKDQVLLDTKKLKAEQACLQYGNHLLIERKRQVISIYADGKDSKELLAAILLYIEKGEFK